MKRENEKERDRETERRMEIYTHTLYMCIRREGERER
jgi:hypothetical protein